MESVAAPLLMTPGPTRVPDRVLRAGSRPMIHHRTPEFSAELAAMVDMLGPLFGTTERVMPVHTTGRGAMEATICNLFSSGDEIAVCCNGKFGELWAGLADSYGLAVHRLARDWSRDIDGAELEQTLRDHPRVRAVALAYGETSTGVQNDVARVAVLAHRHDALILVDGVSSIGGMPFRFDEWQIDVAVTASQKCLMSSPGLSFVALSQRAWDAAGRAGLPRNYWDFTAIRRELAKPRPETPGTTPVHLVLQVAEALRAIHEEGVDEVFARHEAMAYRVRQRLPELGLALQFPALAQHSTTVTAIALAAATPPNALRAAVRRRGILIAAGLGALAASGFRIGHMGDIRLADVDRTLNAIADALAELRTTVQAQTSALA